MIEKLVFFNSIFETLDFTSLLKVSISTRFSNEIQVFKKNLQQMVSIDFWSYLSCIIDAALLQQKCLNLDAVKRLFKYNR